MAQEFFRYEDDGYDDHDVDTRSIWLCIGFVAIFCADLTIFHFTQVLGEDEFVKCLHSVGVRSTLLKLSLHKSVKMPEIKTKSEKMPEIKR